MSSQKGYYKKRLASNQSLIQNLSDRLVCAHDYMSSGLALVMNKNDEQLAQGAAFMAKYAKNDVEYANLTAYFILNGKVNPKIIGAHEMTTYLAYVDAKL